MKSQSLSIAEVIREERKKAGMTQKELGKRLGVTQPMIAQYECGNRIPKILTIRRIADILEADLEPFYYAYTDRGRGVWLMDEEQSGVFYCSVCSHTICKDDYYMGILPPYCEMCGTRLEGDAGGGFLQQGRKDRSK